MKRFVTLLFLLAAATVLLSACVGGVTAPSEDGSITVGDHQSDDVSASEAEQSSSEDGASFEVPASGEETSDDSAQTYISGSFEYALTNDVARIVKYSGDDKELSLPSELDGYSLTAIEAGAFSDSAALQSLDTGDSVVNIATGALSGCTALERLAIGSSVAVFDAFDLKDCDTLESIEVANTNGVFASVDGVLYNGDKTVLLFCPRGLKSESLKLPAGVLSIGDSAFAECTEIKAVVIPTGCALSAFSFFHCTTLKSVTLSDGMTAIPERCFFGCVSLQSVAVPEGVEEIGRLAFFGCVALTKASLPSTVTSIGDDVFKCCSALKSISVKGEYAVAWYNETGKEYIN